MSLCVYSRISHALGIKDAREGYLDAAVCYIAAGNIHVGLLQHIEDFLGIVVGINIGIQHRIDILGAEIDDVGIFRIYVLHLSEIILV